MKSIFTAYEYPIEKYRENLCSDLYNVGHPENFFTYPFRVIIWRTTQKEVIDAQKAEFATQKSDILDEATTQKTPKTTQNDLSTTQKTVLDYFRNYPKGTRSDAANAIPELSEDGVIYIIGRLQQLGFLKREGGRKDGYWVVIER